MFVQAFVVPECQQRRLPLSADNACQCNSAVYYNRNTFHQVTATIHTYVSEHEYFLNSTSAHYMPFSAMKWLNYNKFNNK